MPPLPETYFPTLKRLLDTAVAQSPRMLSRNAEEAVAEGSRLIARSGQLPAAAGSLSYNPWQRDVRVGVAEPLTSDRLLYGASVTQPVYHWGVLKNNTRIGELQLKIAQNQTADAYRVLVQEIRGQFLQLIIRKASCARSRFYLNIVTDRQKVAQSKLAANVIAPSEMFMVNLVVDQASLAVDRAQDDYDSLRRVVGKLCGTEAIKDEDIPDSIPEVSAPSSEVLQAKLSVFTGQKEPHTFAVENLRFQSEIEQMNYHNAKVRLRPRLSAVAGISQDQQSYTANVGQKYGVQSTYVGIQISWSIFDGKATKGMKAISLARRREIERSIEVASDDLKEEARSELRQIGYSARSLEISNRLVASSKGGVAGRKADIKRGLVSEAELNPTLFDFYGTQIDAFTARADLLMKVATFLSTIQEDPALANLTRKTP